MAICLAEAAEWNPAVFLCFSSYFLSHFWAPIQLKQTRTEQLKAAQIALWWKDRGALEEKSHGKERQDVYKAGGPHRGNGSPAFRRCRSVSMLYPLMSNCVLTYVCSTSAQVYMCGCLCVCVRSVRWGQRSQPADASKASGAGNQDGSSQTLIRETHHKAFPVFTALQTFLTVMLPIDSHHIAQTHLTF